MTQKHTPEPWSLSSAQHAAGVITGGPARDLHTGASVQGQIASACLQEWMTTGEHEANARRIVACVNACVGVSNGEIAMTTMSAVLARMNEAEQQRDDLLAALRVAEGFVSEVSEKTGFGQVHTLNLIQAAITKTTGETK